MPKLTINGHAVEVPPGRTSSRRRGRSASSPALLLPSRPLDRRAVPPLHVDIEKTPRPTMPATPRRPTGWSCGPRPTASRDAQVDHGVPPDQPPARLPGVRPGGRVLAADLLHAARPLRPPHAGREGAQAEGRAPRPARHAGRGAVYPLLALRAVLRRGHAHGRARIFERGDYSEIGLFPGTELANKYSGNVVDICPVGALTDRDFRFAVRVWYLDSAKSICPGVRAAATSRCT